MTHPARPIGPPGQAIWDEWAPRVPDPNGDLLALAEATDERSLLRRRVLAEGVPADRHALRVLDVQLAEQLSSVRRAAAWVAYSREDQS